MWKGNAGTVELCKGETTSNQNTHPLHAGNDCVGARGILITILGLSEFNTVQQYFLLMVGKGRLLSEFHEER